MSWGDWIVICTAASFLAFVFGMWAGVAAEKKRAPASPATPTRKEPYRDGSVERSASAPDAPVAEQVDPRRPMPVKPGDKPLIVVPFKNPRRPECPKCGNCIQLKEEYHPSLCECGAADAPHFHHLCSKFCAPRDEGGCGTYWVQLARNPPLVTPQPAETKPS